MAFHVLKGTIVNTTAAGSFQVIENGYLIYKDEKILKVSSTLPSKYKSCEVEDLGDVLIIPGFYDLHLHSGQYPQCGVGMNHQLLDWLQDYTYNIEKRYEDAEFAARVYKQFTRDLLLYGTLGASVFSTTAYTGTDILYKAFIDRGLRAYVGKVCMECHAPDFILKDHETNMRDVVSLMEKYDGHPLVKTIITPRFAPTSTTESLEELGQMSAKYNLPVQSHINENEEEIKWVKELFGESSYAKVYDIHGLYGSQPTLMAHGIHMMEEELALTKERNVILVHCPDSNVNLRSGIMPVRKYLKAGIRIGLGTDVAGGHKLAMTEAIVRAIQLSKLYSLEHPDEEMLSFGEAFHMATVVGGSFFGDVGILAEGYDMDCLIIKDPSLYRELYNPIERLEKFVYTGDDRWITRRYVAGILLSDEE